MRYVLINDTSGTNNPGCQDTVASLVDLYAQHGHRLSDRIPVGAAHGHFIACAKQFPRASCADPSQTPSPPSPAAVTFAPDRGRGPLARLAAKLAQAWPSGNARRRPPEHSAANESFHAAVDKILRSHRSQLAACDHVVINGEGTMHHDRPGAFALLGWAHAAKRLGKHVALVNCTIESFGPAFWDLLRPAVDYLAVREPNSYRYVQPHFPNVQQAADAIFGSRSARSDPPPHHSRAGYSPGVLSYEGIVSPESVRAHLENLHQTFDEVVFFTAEVEDQPFEPLAAELGCQVKPLGALTSENAIEQMQRLSILVSGRYHLCIFALLAETPFVPLQSNTWKMDGLLALSRQRFSRLPLGHAGPLPELSGLSGGSCRQAVSGAAGSDRPVVLPEDFDLAHLTKLACLNVPGRFRSQPRAPRPVGGEHRTTASHVPQ